MQYAGCSIRPAFLFLLSWKNYLKTTILNWRNFAWTITADRGLVAIVSFVAFVHLIFQKHYLLSSENRRRINGLYQTMRKKSNLMNKLSSSSILMKFITIDSLYFNEIHQKWLPVPYHWVGTLPEEWSFKIYTPEKWTNYLHHSNTAAQSPASLGFCSHSLRSSRL